MATVTNQRASQALDGQSTMVLLNASDSAQLANMTIGQHCTFGADITLKTGLICSIDLYGHSFKMNPTQLNFNLASNDTPGYLAEGETITLL